MRTHDNIRLGICLVQIRCDGVKQSSEVGLDDLSDVKRIVAVKTAPDYSPNLGHVGTGTIVAEFLPPVKREYRLAHDAFTYACLGSDGE